MSDWFRDCTYVAIVFIVTFSLAYLLGTSVLYLIDHKMNDISINMPKINIPSNIFRDYFDQIQAENDMNKANADENDVTISKIQPRGDNIIQGTSAHGKMNQKGGFKSVVKGKDFTPSPRSIKVLQNKADIVENFEVATPEEASQTCENNAECNLIPGQTENVCTVDKTCHCLTGIGSRCNRSLTYYKELSEMTVEQREKFKKKAKLSKMTLKDYTNWLSLFQNDLEHLATDHPEHSRNFEKYLRGEEITTKDLAKVKETVVDTATTVDNITSEEKKKCGSSDRIANIDENTGKGFNVFEDNNGSMFAAYPARFE